MVTPLCKNIFYSYQNYFYLSMQSFVYFLKMQSKSSVSASYYYVAIHKIAS